MAATREQIETWFDKGVTKGATHMIVVCDTYDWEDYPCYANGNADAIEQHGYYNDKNMQRVMEVYDLRYGKAEQMREHRAMHLPMSPNAGVERHAPETNCDSDEAGVRVSARTTC